MKSVLLLEHVVGEFLKMGDAIKATEHRSLAQNLTLLPTIVGLANQLRALPSYISNEESVALMDIYQQFFTRLKNGLKIKKNFA